MSDLSSAYFTKAPPSSVAVLDALGATAISIVAPANPHNSLAVDLIEIWHEGLPSLLTRAANWKAQTKRLLPYAKNGSKEFLNVEFGWRPLVEDVTNGALTIGQGHKIISDYRKNANRALHRRFDFDDDVTTTSSTATGPASLPSLTSSIYVGSSNSATITTRTELRRKRWFSGAFVYPDLIGGDSNNRFDHYAHEASLLFGLDLTPWTLWQAEPWTWLLGWFTNSTILQTSLHHWTAALEYSC
jgi:hypothetical protein